MPHHMFAICVMLLINKSIDGNFNIAVHIKILFSLTSNLEIMLGEWYCEPKMVGNAQYYALQYYNYRQSIC